MSTVIAGCHFKGVIRHEILLIQLFYILSVLIHEVIIDQALNVCQRRDNRVMIRSELDSFTFDVLLELLDVDIPELLEVVILQSLVKHLHEWIDVRSYFLIHDVCGVDLLSLAWGLCFGVCSRRSSMIGEGRIFNRGVEGGLLRRV